MIKANAGSIQVSDADSDLYRKQGAWGEQILYDFLATHANQNPQREALVEPPNKKSFLGAKPRRFTWAELSDVVDQLTRILSDAGLGRGDIVIVQLPNTWENVAALFAITRLGAIMSPLSLQSRALELNHAIATLEPKLYLCSQGYHNHNHFTYFANNAVGFEGQAVAIEDLTPQINTQQRVNPQKFFDLQQQAHANDIATLCWTSGTEGRPKAVPRTHNNWRASAIGVSDGFGMDNQAERILLPFPLINTAAIGGVIMPWLYNGGTLVLHQPFDIDILSRQIVEERVSVTLASPTVLLALLKSNFIKEAKAELCLRAVGCGSAAPSAALLSHYEDQLGISIINMFGANEGTLLCSDRQLVPNAQARATVFPRVGYSDVVWPNRAANWLQSKLLDPETGVEITTTEKVGVLAVKGPSIFPGYFNQGHLDRSTFTEDGFFQTGDLFEICSDEQGARLLKVIGRKKELVIRGGYNISPLEVDSALAELPGVVELATAGIPDATYGERLCLYLVPEPGVQITLSSVHDFLRAQGLAKTKWPEQLVMVDILPRNALNKVLRRQLAPTGTS